MNKLTPLRPTKENNSPSKELSSPSKHKKTPLNELLALIKASGLILPSHLSKFLTSGFQNLEQPILKLNPTHSESEEVKKLKIKLTDQQFQIKKIEEDYAQYKRINRIQKQKQIKKLQEACAKLKNNLQNNSEDSIYQMSKIKQEHETQVESLKQKHKAELTQEIQKLTLAFEEKLKASEKLRHRQVMQLQKSSDLKIAELRKAHDELVQKLKLTHATEMKELGLKHKQILEDKEKKFESIYTAVQSQRKTQEKLHQRTKIQANKEKQKLQSELCYEKNVKKQCQQEITQKQKDIKALKSKIKDLEITIILNEDRYKKRVQQIESDTQKQKKAIEACRVQQIQTLLQSHKEQLTKFQETISKIEAKMRQREQIHQEQLSQLHSAFSERPSKKQDIFEIQRLRQLTCRKEEQIRKLIQDLKHCNLQLQNKEDIYTRIFKGANPSRQEKKSLNKEKEQLMPSDQKALRDTVFRKSQTADIKFLLKVYNNSGK